MYFCLFSDFLLLAPIYVPSFLKKGVFGYKKPKKSENKAKIKNPIPDKFLHPIGYSWPKVRVSSPYPPKVD